MEDILIILLCIVLALLIMVLFIIINSKKENKDNGTNRRVNAIIQSNTPLEKEVPAKYTKKQFKKIEEKVNKVDDLDKKYSELESKIKGLFNQVELLRKDIRTLQEKNTKSLINASDNPSLMVSKKKSTANKGQSANISYEHLTIGGDGHLTHCEEGYPVYYRAWKEREILLFEFVNSDRTKKAINNRSTYIEPFCNKTEESKLPDESDCIETITPGTLNSDYTVKEKAIIKYK